MFLVCRVAVFGFWVFLVLAANSCYGDNETVEVVGSVECADCKQHNIKTSQAFSGLHVTINCKSENGKVNTRGKSELNQEGKFKAVLSTNEIAENLEEDCFAQLLSASGAPCPNHNDQEASKVVFRSKANGKKVLGLNGNLKFSPKNCSSDFLWLYFPPLPHLPGFPFYHPPPSQDSTPPPPPQPPVYDNPPAPSPVPVYDNPPPSQPVASPPRPLVPVYYRPPPSQPEASPPPPPVPVYASPAPSPVYENLVPPPVPVVSQPPLSPPSMEPIPPPTPTYKKPLPPPVPTIPPPIPTYKKPLPPPVPIYKKPTPVPTFEPTPSPDYGQFLPPSSPVFKKPLPPPVPLPTPAIEKPLPPLASRHKSFPKIPKAPPIPRLPPNPTTPRKFFNKQKSPLPPSPSHA